MERSEAAARQAQWLGLGFVLLTVAFLALGVTFPTLEVRGRLLGIPLGGRQRSILGLIGSLWQTNILLAALISLLSLVIPVTKLGLTLVMLWREDLAHHPKLNALVHHISRWSMVDVFSMTIVVFFISFNQICIHIFSTRGLLMIGFYFFLTYCLLSIASTYFLKKETRLRDPHDAESAVRKS
ncbi:MAG: paraquat-inducible protein A [Acidobacteriota bacterium]|nr:paraquat-inducible protein A [Acidobacteriota bacterium]